jgi:hypothetical protein
MSDNRDNPGCVWGTVAFLGVVAFVAFLAWGAVRGVAAIQFDRKCEGYLKRAADANTVELAKRQLGTAIDYIEQNGMTSGYTSVVYRTPSEDVGFWYTNLKSSLHELEAVSPNAAQLEKSNLLIKLRETLLDTSGGSVTVTVPAGISVFPKNGFYAFWGMLSAIIALVGMVAMGKHARIRSSTPRAASV